MGCKVSQVQPIVVDAPDVATNSTLVLRLAKSIVGCTSGDTRRALWQKLLAPDILDDAEQKIEFERLEAAVDSVDAEQLKIINNDVPRTDRDLGGQVLDLQPVPQAELSSSGRNYSEQSEDSMGTCAYRFRGPDHATGRRRVHSNLHIHLHTFRCSNPDAAARSQHCAS